MNQTHYMEWSIKALLSGILRSDKSKSNSTEWTSSVCIEVNTDLLNR